MLAVTFVFISSSHFQALKSAQAFIRHDFGDPQSVTDKLPLTDLTVKSHVRCNINKGRDIKSASDVA